MIRTKSGKDAGAVRLLQQIAGVHPDRRTLALYALDRASVLQTNLSALPLSGALESELSEYINEVIAAVEVVLENR